MSADTAAQAAAEAIAATERFQANPAGAVHSATSQALQADSLGSPRAGYLVHLACWLVALADNELVTRGAVLAALAEEHGSGL